MTATLTLPPSADLAGDWELVNPIPFSGSGYTEPKVLGWVGVGYQGGDAGAQALNTGLALPAISTPPNDITFVGADDVYAESIASTLSVPIPAVTINAGDLIEIMVSTQELEVNDPGIPNTPAGYSVAWELYTTEQYRPHVTKFYMIAAGGESGTVSVTWGANTGNRTGVCQVWRGVDQANPYDTAGYISGAPPWVFGYSISPPDPPSTTVSVDGAVVQAIAVGDRSSASTATISAGFTTTINGSPSVAPFYRAFANGHKTANAGTVDPPIYSWNRSNWVAATDVLRPAGGPVTAILVTGVDDGTTTAQVGTAPDLIDQNEEQTLTAQGGLGSFTLTFDGQTTASISATATAADILSALEGLSNIAVNDVSVDGGPLGTAPVRVTFTGTYQATDVSLLTSSDSNLDIEVTTNAATSQTFTFEDVINVPESSDEPQIHVWSLPMTSGYFEGRVIEYTVADHDTLDSWGALLLIVEGLHATFPSATSADTVGDSSAATFASLTPPDHGSKILALLAKAADGNYASWPTSSPTPSPPSGYTGYDATADRMTLSAYISPSVAAEATTPGTARWAGLERWASGALALKPLVASATVANLFSVLADNDQDTWLELSGSLGQMYEVLEVGQGSVPVGSYKVQASVRFTHEADGLNPIEVALVGINSDDSIVLGAPVSIAPSLTNSPETVETSLWSTLSDGSTIGDYTRLGIMFRSLQVTPGTSSHRIYDAELILTIEEGGPVASAVAGPTANGDPITWTYSSESGFPQASFEVMVIQGGSQDPTLATAAADPQMAGTGEIIYHSGIVDSSTARQWEVPVPIGRNSMTYAVRCWARLDNGLLVASPWDTDTQDLPGSYPDGPDLTQEFFENFDIGAATGPADGILDATWLLYDDDAPGHGYGRRRPDAWEIAADGTANNGFVLETTAENGAGGDAGFVVAGGLKIDVPLIYGRYEVRVRADGDPDEITSMVCIVWPDDDPVLFPVVDGGINPAAGELDYWESGAADRDDRNPTKTFVHRLNPDATPPYTPRGQPGSDDQQIEVEHPVDGSVWRKVVFDWWGCELRVTIDNAAQPTVITRDPAWIPDWTCRPTLQFDIFGTGGVEPALTGGNNPTMQVDYILIHSYGTDPVYDPALGVVTMDVEAPAGVSSAWVRRSVDQGATYEFTENSPYDITASASNQLVDSSPPFNESVRYEIIFDNGPMSETSTPQVVGANEISTPSAGWYLQDPTDPSLNLVIDVAEEDTTETQRSVVTTGESGALVARSKPLGDIIPLTIRTSTEAERLALTAILDTGRTLRLVNVFGREWKVAQVGNRRNKIVRVKPLDADLTGLRDFHLREVTFQEVIE